MSLGLSPSQQQQQSLRVLSTAPNCLRYSRCSSKAPYFHTHLLCFKVGSSLFRVLPDKDPWCVIFPPRAPLFCDNLQSTWRFQKNLSCLGEQKGAPTIMNSVTDWSTGSCIKVVGLGTRASTALQFCHESSLLPSAELWVSSGDGADVQSFGLLSKNNVKIVKGQALHKERNIIVFIEVLAGSLLEQIDLCLVFEHDVLFKREKVTLAEALRVADSTVLYAIKAISDLTLGDQLKLYDAPPEGLRDISDSEILSILGHAGNTWAGFGSSYSIKSAVQRAAFESPFLQGLIPGVKGLVACTIASAEEKGRKDIQAALHALRCTIGPRAQLVCTSVKEPTLKRGLILATILLTRIDNVGGHDVSKQYTTSQEISSPLNLFSGGSMGLSTSMNGRELRKTSLESPIENTDGKLNGTKLQEASEPVSLNSIDGSEQDPLSMLNTNDFFVPSGTLHESVNVQNESTEIDENLEDIIAACNVATVESARMLKLSDADIDDDILIASSCLGGLQGLCTNYQSAFEEGSFGNDLRSTFLEAVENKSLNDSRSSSPDFEGQVDLYEKQAAFSEENSALEKDNDGKWRFPSLSSIISRGKENENGEKKSLFGWESGPYSAAAEAWAQTRQRLGNLGTLERNKVYKLPIGVRSTIDFESETLTIGREEGKEWDSVNQSALLNFAAPLGRAFSSGLEAVADMYNAASAKIFKKDEIEEATQVSSFLSERAASMLESERSSAKLPPMVEMRYKNGVYKGRCQGGLPEGKGRLSYKDGSFYYGLWKQGKRAGIGSFYYANGDVFQGYWRDDQKHGKGWFYFHTGDRLYADFWKGKANGEGRYYSAKGDVFFGYFRENWRHGESLSIESGVRWSEIWDQGVLISRSRFEDSDQS
eukprot:c20742_g1_i2 orf=100-2736(+)